MKQKTFFRHTSLVFCALGLLALLPSSAFAEGGSVYGVGSDFGKNGAFQYPVTWGPRNGGSEDSLSELYVTVKSGEKLKVDYSLGQKCAPFDLFYKGQKLDKGVATVVPAGTNQIKFEPVARRCGRAVTPRNLSSIDVQVLDSSGKPQEGRLFAPIWNFGGLTSSFEGGRYGWSGSYYAQVSVPGTQVKRVVEIRFNDLAANSYALAAYASGGEGLASTQTVNRKICGVWGDSQGDRLSVYNRSIKCLENFHNNRLPLYVNPPTTSGDVLDYVDLSGDSSDAEKLKPTVTFTPKGGEKSCNLALANNVKVGSPTKVTAGGSFQVELKSAGYTKFSCKKGREEKFSTPLMHQGGATTLTYLWDGSDLEEDDVLQCEVTHYLGRIDVGMADAESVGGLTMYDLYKDASGGFQRRPLRLFWNDSALDLNGDNGKLGNGRAMVKRSPAGGVLSAPYDEEYKYDNVYSAVNPNDGRYRAWGNFNKLGRNTAGQNTLVDTYAYYGESKSTFEVTVVAEDTDNLDGSVKPMASRGNGTHDFQEFCKDDALTPTIGDKDGDGIPDDKECLGSPCDPTEDKDGDGKPNVTDTDSDGDGIPDSVECKYNSSHVGQGYVNGCVDTDQDGVPDFLDKDSDNDGILDDVECGGYVTNSTSGGIVRVNGCLDTDNNDRTPDYIDTDSDGDGILDIDEARDEDADGIGDIKPSQTPCEDSDKDGLCDVFDPTKNMGKASALKKPLTDTDKDGVPNYRDLDSDGDNISDETENGNAIGKGHKSAKNDELGDTDVDGVPDFLDKDSDNDGIPDRTEGYDYNGNGDSSDDVTLKGDANGNGLDDAFEPTPKLADTDKDSVPNYIDKDSDGDGIPDHTEGFDFNGDGKPDHKLTGDDKNHNGLDDAFDPACREDNSNCTVIDIIVVMQYPDTDGDGITDYLDKDSDGDGITDTDEAFDFNQDGHSDVDMSDRDNSSDKNKNGIADGYEKGTNGALPTDDDGNIKYPDADKDGVVNYLDPDSDNDNVSDHEEAFGKKDDLSGKQDANKNGVDDRYDTECTSANPCGGIVGEGPTMPNTNNNDKPDFLDPDDDGDGVPTRAEDKNQNLDPTDDDANGNGTPDYLDKYANTRYSDPGHNPDLDFKGTATFDSNSSEVVDGTGIVAGGCSSVPVEGIPAELPLLGLLFGFTWFGRRRRGDS